MSRMMKNNGISIQPTEKQLTADSDALDWNCPAVFDLYHIFFEPYLIQVAEICWIGENIARPMGPKSR